MKCVCGYQVYEYTDKLQEPFRQIQIYMESIYCEVKDNKRDEYYIYACPKCGTLKIDL
jgi:acetone carboxylase gamma subunit